MQPFCDDITGVHRNRIPPSFGARDYLFHSGAKNSSVPAALQATSSRATPRYRRLSDVSTQSVSMSVETTHSLLD